MLALGALGEVAWPVPDSKLANAAYEVRADRHDGRRTLDMAQLSRELSEHVLCLESRERSSETVMRPEAERDVLVG